MAPIARAADTIGGAATGAGAIAAPAAEPVAAADKEPAAPASLTDWTVLARPPPSTQSVDSQSLADTARSGKRTLSQSAPSQNAGQARSQDTNTRATKKSRLGAAGTTVPRVSHVAPPKAAESARTAPQSPALALPAAWGGNARSTLVADALEGLQGLIGVEQPQGRQLRSAGPTPSKGGSQDWLTLSGLDSKGAGFGSLSS